MQELWLLAKSLASSSGHRQEEPHSLCQAILLCPQLTSSPASHFHQAHPPLHLPTRPENLAFCTASLVLSRPTPPPTPSGGQSPSALLWGETPFLFGRMFCVRKLASFSAQGSDVPPGDKSGEQPSECLFPPLHRQSLSLAWAQWT